MPPPSSLCSTPLFPHISGHYGSHRGRDFTFPIAALPPFHDQPWMLAGAGWLRGTVRCACWRNKHHAGGTSLSGGAGKESWATRDKAPIPNLPYGSIQTLVCIVLYLYVDVRPSRQFFFCFCKEEFSAGHNNHHHFNNYYYPYLLPVAPVYLDVLSFMLTLCCVALPIDHSFSVFITV